MKSRALPDMLDYEKAISVAEQKCADRGIRFTRRRKQVLAVLIKADAALSAYEIAELCDAEGDSKMPAMSVYRILELLEDGHLIHRLELANKYVSCSHISCSHKHKQSQFLICDSCRHVEEIDLCSEAVDALRVAASAAGFNSISSQLEIKGWCAQCQPGRN
jgi:Fur family zinc uptake transcriptional regulator